MKFGTLLFRDDKWVLRSRNDENSIILHECIKESNPQTLSEVYHYPMITEENKRWQCSMCDKKATKDIITIWIMLNWSKMHYENPI